MEALATAKTKWWFWPVIACAAIALMEFFIPWILLGIVILLGALFAASLIGSAFVAFVIDPLIKKGGTSALITCIALILLCIGGLIGICAYFLAR